MSSLATELLALYVDLFVSLSHNAQRTVLTLLRTGASQALQRRWHPHQRQKPNRDADRQGCSHHSQPRRVAWQPEELVRNRRNA